MGHLGRGGRRGTLCRPHALHHDPATPRPGLPPESSPTAVPRRLARKVIPAGLGALGQALGQDSVPQAKCFLLLVPQSGSADIPGWGLGGDPGASLLCQVSCPQRPQSPREGWAIKGKGHWGRGPWAPSPESW